MGTDWKRFLRFVACCFVPVIGLVVGIEQYASAQGVGGSLGSFFPVPIVGSFEPITTFEKFCGPLLPKCDIGNTFRSEVGTGYGFASIQSAKLTIGGVDYDLAGLAALDQAPPYAEIYSDLRLWRLGFRSYYYYFDNRSVNSTLGKLEWSGARLGLDLDAVQHEWLTFGVSADYYFIDPRFNGAFFQNGNGPNVPPVNIDVKGSKPLTWGLYFRYMPPAILGMPVHFDAFFNSPITGSKLTSYGASLSFRPQIYRFDLACKLGLERTNLKFSQPSNADLNMEWQMFKLDFAAYF